ncbi:uncharacterized protein LOC132271669 [Cornus florida]|uniref:uncharacterized protein LOC132271669 n=1 Tax=Cornus florida TaxID=4283 RepID=UPI00289917A0|nr:uncharacterized protein LOC132271669 [Cornus florida]
MVKLASARESRIYGPRLARNRSEYMNAGLYVFATIVLLCGFAAQLSSEPKSGLVLLLIGLALIIFVNVHDLLAHLAGIDYRLPLMEFDVQLGLVEFAVPVVQITATLLYFLGILFIFIQEEKGYGYDKWKQHALNLLIAGTVLWLLGSIHNSCQIYERADGHVQILQECVLIPFLMGSLLFLVGSIINVQEQASSAHHGIELLGMTWVWLGIFGSILFFIGGITNVVKVFKMQQMNGLRLEKLRGGAQERLIRVREGQVRIITREREGQVPLIREREGQAPLILEREGQVLPIRDEQKRKMQEEEGKLVVGPPTPYKDVLVSGT